MADLVVPDLLRTGVASEGRHEWLAALPAQIADAGRRWGLTVGEPFQPGGKTAWVAPATRAGDPTPLVLKVGFAHFEARDEAVGLRLWAGDGAVRVVAAEQDDETVVLLLERCVPGTPLNTLPEPDQDPIMAAVLRRLWRDPPAGHGLRPLSSMCDSWADSFERALTEGRVDLDPGLARAGVDLFRSLPRSATRSALIGTDLHAGNVLAAERDPWLAIDPKPYVGDPTYDVLQHLLNCHRLHREPGALADRLAGLCGLDPERLRLWLFARCVVETPHWPDLAAVARLVAPR
ncbi:MAG: aminoglycoside phosphotransferase family protein [Actinomycetota bacterium]|nr:aminoglycoside phosphotransferase family protein [Actinomycetota bacterium]